MNKILFASAVVALLASCASSYRVEGTSSVSALDGSKLYLKTIKSGQLRSIDSCDVVHGEFHFAGLLDTIRMANLYMDDESILPVVLEEGDIVIRISLAGQSVGGTPLNDSLYKFIDRHTQLINLMNELGHKQNQMILDGIDEQTIAQEIESEANRITAEEDQLVTKFIEANYDNVLGPGVFMMLTSQYPYPILTPQIEYLMSRATKAFKEDVYVREYYQTAQENEARMNGTSEAVAPAPSPTDSVAPSLAPVPLTNAPQK
jgi:hypothetical protein